MDIVKKEIREALLGDLIPTADGRLAVSFTRLAKYRNGFGDGYDKVLIFGVMCRRRWYLSRKGSRQMRELAVKGMQDMGRMLSLASDPDREAVYCTYLIGPPAVVTYERGKDGVIEVTVYSARGFGGWISCYRSLNAFQKKVPEVLQRMSEEDEREKQTAIKERETLDRIQTRQAKKDRKLEKKLLRKEKRRERMQRLVGTLPKLPQLSTSEGQTATQIRQNQAGEQLTGAAMNSPEEMIAENVMPAQQPGTEAETEAMRTGQTRLGTEAETEAMRAGQTRLGTEAETEAMRIGQTGLEAETEIDAMRAEQARLGAGTEIDAMRAEQARLEAEAERAKLAARAARAKLEAAQAKLEAEAALAQLAEVEAQLSAGQNTAQGQTQPAERRSVMDTQTQQSAKSTQAPQNSRAGGKEEDSGSGSNNRKNNGYGSKNKHKKKR